MWILKKAVHRCLGGEAEDGEATSSAVTPFELEADFDDEHVELHERFSIARALVEGEYYDREPS